MLLIRREQLQAFEEAAIRRFERIARDFLCKIWALECEEMGPELLHQLVRSGIERAGQYRVVTERGVLRYLNLMVCCGEHFDTECRWASEILADRSLGEDLLMDLLEDAAAWVLDCEAATLEEQKL